MRQIHELSLDGLAAFARVARLSSFTRAAEQLHVTQSAVSHRVRELEGTLGVELLARTSRSVRLTSEGRVLFDAVEAGLSAIADGLAALEAGRPAEVLTISCSPSFAIRCLLPRASLFRQAHPDLELHIAADDRIADPRRDDIDICIRYGAGRYPGMHVEALGTEWVYPVCSPELVRRRRLRRPAQLAEQCLLHHDVLRDHPGRVDWRRWLERAGLSDLPSDRGPRFSHAHLALAAALASEGVALGRSSLVAEDIAAGRLVRPFGPRIKSGLAYWLVTQRGAHRRPEVRAFGDFVRNRVLGSRRGKQVEARR